MNPQIESAFARVNFRRRVRTIDRQDIAQCMQVARRYGYAFVVGGKVAKAYSNKWRADTAAVAVLRTGGRWYIKFGVADAARDASSVSWFGPQSIRDCHMAQWHHEMVTYPLTENAADAMTRWLPMSAKDVRETRKEKP